MKISTAAVASIVAATVIAAAAFLLWPASAAQRWAKAHPGGQLTGRGPRQRPPRRGRGGDDGPLPGGEIVYTSSGTVPFTVTLTKPAGAASPACPPDWLCVYANHHFGYPRGRTQACGYLNLTSRGWFPHIQSAHTNRPAQPPAQAEVRLFHVSGSPPVDSNVTQVAVLNPASRSLPSPTTRVDYLYRRCS